MMIPMKEMTRPAMAKPRGALNTDKGEDDAEQPENPVKDWNPAEDEADEGENKTGGANTI